MTKVNGYARGGPIWSPMTGVSDLQKEKKKNGKAGLGIDACDWSCRDAGSSIPLGIKAQSG